MNTEQWSELLVSALTVARNDLEFIGDSGAGVAHQGSAFGSLTDDTELHADIVLGRSIASYVERTLPMRRIVVEGQGLVYENHAGKYDAYIDPLDGSLCYRDRLPKGYGLPYTGVLQIFDASLVTQTRFGDLVAAGVIDYRTSALWIALRTESGYTSTLDGASIQTGSWKVLDIRNMIGFSEPYYPSNRALTAQLFNGEKGWLAAPKSAAYEMALVASGQAAFYICDQQKSHELAAGMALVLGAGGVAVDFDGCPLTGRSFDFNVQVPVILTANQEIADQMLERLRLILLSS